MSEYIVNKPEGPTINKELFSTLNQLCSWIRRGFNREFISEEQADTLLASWMKQHPASEMYK